MTSTQNTQYDQIGTKYNSMHELPAVLPERPSVVAALGNIKGARCLDLACGTGRCTHLLHTLGALNVHGLDISSAMINGAQTSYPSTKFPTLKFSVADCSKPPLPLPTTQPFDIIFSGWFLNYAGTRAELTRMFSIIETYLKRGGRFVGLTTNPHDPRMKEPKVDFYGINVTPTDIEYRDPDGKDGEVLGIKARVETSGVSFECFQFKKEVYERCALEAGLKVEWKEPVLPEGEFEKGYWDKWLERPTFAVLVARRVADEEEDDVGGEEGCGCFGCGDD